MRFFPGKGRPVSIPLNRLRPRSRRSKYVRPPRSKWQIEAAKKAEIEHQRIIETYGKRGRKFEDIISGRDSQLKADWYARRAERERRAAWHRIKYKPGEPRETYQEYCERVERSRQRPLFDSRSRRIAYHKEKYEPGQPRETYIEWCARRDTLHNLEKPTKPTKRPI